MREIRSETRDELPTKPELYVAIYLGTTKTLVDVVSLRFPSALPRQLAIEPLIVSERDRKSIRLFLQDTIQQRLADELNIAREVLVRSTASICVVTPGAPGSMTVQPLRDVFSEVGWEGGQARFITEVEAAAVLEEGPVVVASCGTGCTVGGRLSSHGRFAFSGGAAFPFDALGGGYHVGSELIRTMAEVSQGWKGEPEEDLARRVLSLFGADDFPTFFEAQLLSDPVRSRRNVSALAVYVSDLAASGNNTASAILSDAAGRTADKIGHVATRIGAPSPFSLVLTGGLGRLSETFQGQLRGALQARGLEVRFINGEGLMERGAIATARIAHRSIR